MAKSGRSADRAGAKRVVKVSAKRTPAPAENSAQTAKKPRGRPFEKGRSGNPGGRPAIPEHVREACRALTETAVATLKEVMTDAGAPAAARVSAANSVLDRAWGKPESDVRVGGLLGAPPIGTAQIDVAKWTTQQIYEYCLNGAPIPDLD